MAIANNANLCIETPLIGDLVQPHGALLLLRGAPPAAVRGSANVPQVLGLPWEEIVCRNAADCFESATADFWQGLSVLADGRFHRGNLVTLAGEVLHATAHRLPHSPHEAVILEVEPQWVADNPLREARRNGLQAALGCLRRSTDWEHLLQVATVELRQLTGCDRVMIYQFDETGAGAVIAESLEPGVGDSYLGLHYPSTDIPLSARAAYQRAPLRYIPDFTAAPVALTLGGSNALPLDCALLRYPSDCCQDYHINMGTVALFVLPLLQSGRLWGLVSCHHRQPHHLAPEVRADCELLAQFLSLELAERRNRAERAYEEQLQGLRADVIATLADARNLQATLVACESRLLELTGAAGAAICWQGDITSIGRTPSKTDIRKILTWAETAPETKGNLLATHRLSALYPEAAAFSDTASGLLLLQISRLQHRSVLWFRPEIPQTVTWAGDPQTAAIAGAKPVGPRASFARWQEIKRDCAQPWHPAELVSARELRNAIASFALQRTNELERLNRELERSNRELASFAFAASHDLKEPLRGIHNYASFLLEDYGDRLDLDGRARLEVLVALSRRMENLIDVLLYYSRLGQTELDVELVNLDDLVAREIELFHLSRPQIDFEFQRPRPLPSLYCDPTLVRELFSNLIGNACKYNDRANPGVEIGYLTPTERAQQFPQQSLQPLPTLLYVRDNGIGIRERHQQTIFRLFKRLHTRDRYGGGTGAGLAIARRIVERHGGQIWVESTYGEGSTFFFDLGASRPPYKT